MRIGLLTAVLVLAGMPAFADEQTLADIRQELTVLNVEIQKLKRELSTTGAPSSQLGGGSVLDRVGAIEAEMQRLTAQTERLEGRIGRVVADGTNRIGDLEFRLVELEGGDVSQLGETSTLGGVADAAIEPAPGRVEADGSLLAIGEQSDFEAARTALDEGAFQKAASLFAAFNETYPGSPLASKADLERGRALDATGDTREAARAYLASFSGDTTGPEAPVALYELGAALGRLGQTSQACVTLGEVGARFPGARAADAARDEMQRLGCS